MDAFARQDALFLKVFAMSLAEQRFVNRPRWLSWTFPAGSTAAVGTKAGAASERLPFLDLLRAVSAHVIVWHHLVLYGPLSEAAADLVPTLSGLLIDYGPNAVQVFLVIGGFLTAQSLAKRREFRLRDCWSLIRRRYLRIAGPYLCVLAVAIAVNWLADLWMDDESITPFPTVPQVLAHAVFLHDLLGYEALSAGLWYLAIDFQLALLAAAGWWVSHRMARTRGLNPIVAAQAIIWPLAAASLFWMNRRPEWDVVALYFFGSYALGMITAWVLAGKLPRWCFWAFAGLVVLALLLEFRPRLAVALAAGVLVYGASAGGWLVRYPRNRILLFAGMTSYSLFLIHFPVCLLVNAWLSTVIAPSEGLYTAAIFSAYGLSVLASIAFYFGIERRFARSGARA